MFAVNDWRHRCDGTRRVVNNGVNWGIFDDREVSRKVFLRLRAVNRQYKFEVNNEPRKRS